MNDNQREFIKKILELDNQLNTVNKERTATVERIEALKKEKKSTKKWDHYIEKYDQQIKDLQIQITPLREKAVQEFSAAHDLMMLNKSHALAAMEGMKTATLVYYDAMEREQKQLLRFQKNIQNFKKYKESLYPYIYGEKPTKEQLEKEFERLGDCEAKIENFQKSFPTVSEIKNERKIEG